MKKKRPTAAKDDTPVPRCEDHSKEVILFCLEADCQKPLCTTCLVKEHTGHKVCEIEEQKRETVKRKIKLLRENLETKKMIMNAGMVNLYITWFSNKQCTACVTELKKRKEEIVQEIEKHMKRFEEQTRETNAKMDDELSAINENIKILNDVSETFEESEPQNEYQNITGTLAKIKENNEKHLSGTKQYKYPQCVVTNEAREMRLATITQKEISIVLPQFGEGRGRDAGAVDDGGDGPPTKKRKIANAADLNCTVLWTTNIEEKILGCFALLRDDTVVLDCLNKEANRRKLKQYNLQTGAEVSCVEMENMPWGMTGVQLGGRSTLTVSYRDKKKIEFRDADDLSRVIYTHSVAPHKPGALCTVSLSTLLYADVSKNPPEVHWLVCSTEHPEPVAGKSLRLEDVTRVSKLLFLTHRDLLVGACRQDGVKAYSISTGELVWSVAAKLPGMGKSLSARGVAADGRGHLYVCDYVKELSGNGCVQVFSLENGKHLGPLIRRGENGFGNPLRLCWCESSSSLVVVHYTHGWRISKIKIHDK